MSTPPTDDLTAAAAQPPVEGSQAASEEAVAEAQVYHHQQQQQQQDRLLAQLQLLQQHLGLRSHSTQPQSADEVASTDLASALDSLAAAAAAAAAVDPSRWPQITQQEATGHQLQRAVAERGSGLSLRVHNGGQGPTAAGSLQQADPLATSAMPGDIRAFSPPSHPFATRQQHVMGGRGDPPAAAAEASHPSRATQQQWKRARVHGPQQPQVAQQSQQQQQQLQQVQAQHQQQPPLLQQQPASQVAMHEPQGSLPAAHRAPEQRLRSDLLQQLLQQQRLQQVLPELGRQALLQSLDPNSQCLVECGSVTGIFSVDSERILCLCSNCSAGKGPPGPEFMPSEFERHGGMAACKKWRFSIKVADGGPGMTLGRWLDMRGLQISSYPAKLKGSAARSKRPLETGRGQLGGPSESGAQTDISQLLAGVTGGGNKLSSALRSLLSGAGGSTSSGTAPAAAALIQALAEAAAAGGGTAAAAGTEPAAGGSSRLSELAGMVAQLLATETLSAAAPGAQLQSPAAPAAAAGGGGGVLTGTPLGGEPSISPLRSPEAVAAGEGRHEDVPLGYATQPQGVSGPASGLQQGPSLQRGSSLQQSQLSGPGSAGRRQQLLQQQLRSLLSTSPDQNPMSLARLSTILQQGAARQQQTAGAEAAEYPGQAVGASPPAAASGLPGIRSTLAAGTAAQQSMSPPGSGLLSGPLGRLPSSSQPQQQQLLSQLQRQASVPSYETLRQSLALLPGVTRAAAAEELNRTLAAAGGYQLAAAGEAAALQPDPAAADWQTVTSNLESRLDMLLEDRRRRKQLEQQLAAQSAEMAQLQLQLADEHKRRVAAEQRLASLSSRLMQKLDNPQEEEQQPQQEQLQQQLLQTTAAVPQGAATVEGAAGASAGAPPPAIATETPPSPAVPAAEQHQQDDQAASGGMSPAVQEDPAAQVARAAADDHQPTTSAAAAVVKQEEAVGHQ